MIAIADVTGRLGGGGVVNMRKLYSITICLDGEELTRSFPAMSREEAKEGARRVLDAFVDLGAIRAGYVALFAGDEDEAEALGCWDWAIEEPEVVWREAE